MVKANELPVLSFRILATMDKNDNVTSEPTVLICDPDGNAIGRISHMNEVSWDIIGDSWLFDITLTAVGTVVINREK